MQRQVGVAIIKQSTSNQLAVARGVRAEVEAIRTGLPAGINMAVAVDYTTFIEESVFEVYTQKHMPIGILGSLAICTVLYIFMSLVITGLAPYETLNVPHPVTSALETAGPSLAWLEQLVNIAVTFGLASVVLVLFPPCQTNHKLYYNPN